MDRAPQAVLLAAGSAHRLLPLTEHRPKGMLLIGGKPLLQHTVEALKAHGVTDITIVIGAHGEKIQSFFKDGADFGVSIRYAHQPEPLGTLHALQLARAHLDADRALWVIAGHVFVTAAQLAPLARIEESALLLADAGDVHEQGIPTVRGDRLAAMHRGVPVLGSTRVSTGVFRCDQRFLAALDSESHEELHDLDLALGAYAQQGGGVRTVGLDGPWHTVVDPWDVLRLNERVLDTMPAQAKPKSRPLVRGAVHIGENTEIAPTATITGPVTIGDGCSIGDYTVVGPYVSIRNNTVVAAHCEVRRSILNNNVLVDSHSVVRGCILDDGVQVAPGFISHEDSTSQGPLGCIIGRDSMVGPGVRAQGGAILRADTKVRPGGILQE